jgi:hypothetical protein
MLVPPVNPIITDHLDPFGACRKNGGFFFANLGIHLKKTMKIGYSVFPPTSNTTIVENM